ncbi:MAG: response regulator transcription factor [Vicinamibacterales bacterium]
MPASTSGEARRVVRVLVVDDHPVVRRGLAELIADAPDLVVTGQAGTIDDALSAAAKAPPDVAVVDLALGSESGLDLVQKLLARHPSVGVLVLSGYDERLYADHSLKAGALGYVMKDQAPEELLTAVRRVAAGKPYVSADTAERILATMGTAHRPQHDRSPIDRLSDRERHVLTLMGRGLATREIAAQLQLSVKTIESHYAHLKEKLGARNGRELTRLAVTWTEGGPHLGPIVPPVPPK